MSAEANRTTVRDAFAAWQAGTGPITEVFADDMVWGIEGHSLASRQYAGKQEFIDDGDTVVVVWDGHGVANDAQAYENSYAWIMRMRDGKVVDGTAFYDSLSFNDLWTRVTLT